MLVNGYYLCKRAPIPQHLHLIDLGTPMSNLLKARVLTVHHWNDTLFSFTTTRDPGLRFRNGHFCMIGLEQPSGKPPMRATHCQRQL